MNIVILGPQGSGKGTQAELIAKKFKLTHVDMGLLLRAVANKKTKLGIKLNETINLKKELVENGEVGAVLRVGLKQIPSKKGIILDGAPRRLTQIGTIESVLAEYGRSLDWVIFIDIPEKESIERISKRYQCPKCFKRYILGKDIANESEECRCGGKIQRRLDDTPVGIKKRLQIFRQETLPVIREYGKRKILLEIDGTQSVATVFKKIEKSLG